MDTERATPGFYEALGRTVQVLRTDQGLDRRNLAARTGISYSYLAAIENGKKPPSSKVLFAIASALGLRSHELLASVETRLRRQQLPTEQAPPLAASSARGNWFHARAVPPPQAAPASPHPDAPLDPAPPSRPPAPHPGIVPYSAAGFLMELERLNSRLSDEDRDLVLGLARRLAEDGPPAAG